MTQIHHRRSSDNPYIETIWQSKNVTDGLYHATPDGSWDLITLIDTDGSKQMMLTGQATKTYDVPYRAGTGSVVISFVAGAYMPHIPAAKIRDLVEILPKADAEHFMLAGHRFEFPTYENAEALVEQLQATGILKRNALVDTALAGSSQAGSNRTAQRHFAQTTGLTQKSMKQIRRAKQAVKMIQTGSKPVDVAAETGYADQAHLSKSLKRIMGTTPSDVDHIHKL